MPKFTLKIIESVNGKQTFEELVIDGNEGQLTEFEKELIDTTYLSEYKTLISYMTFVAQLKSLPNTKFKDLTPSKELVKEYEFKSKHLRIYAIQKFGGKVIVLCGFKSNQKDDLKEFRNIKNEYLKSITK